MSPQPARILLVDDEQSVQKLLAYPLRKEGYEVVPALDGEEALERCRGQSFDLAVPKGDPVREQFDCLLKCSGSFAILLLIKKEPAPLT